MKNLFYFFSARFLKILLTKNLITFLTIILILLAQQSCNTTEPPSNQTLTLKLEDVSCTEAWIKFSSTNIQIPNNISLLINGSVKKTFTLNTQDSLLYIDSLLPNQTYKFKAVLNTTNNPQPTTNELTVTTMDTTSHEFTWQSWEFGTTGSSTLYDVAIIDENDIWAVGEINIADTSINGYTTYNAVHWDGTKWELKKIGGQGGWACHTVFAFSANDIWFEGNIHWNGSTYTAHMNGWPLMPNGDGWQVNKLWGSSSEDLYAVGNNGNIAHWDGRKWTKIESGTTLNINDIWGDYNQETGEWEILAVCGNILHGWENDRDILKILTNQSEKVNSYGSKWPLSSVWFKANKNYYVVGSGIYQNKKLGHNWTGEPLDVTTYFVRMIRANYTNDIIIVGAFGEVLHFNGYRWKSFIDQTYLPSGTYLSVSVKDNLFTAVGYNSRQAVILKGKR